MAMLLAHDGVEVGTDAIGTALIDRMAGHALLINGFALRHVGGGKQSCQRHGCFTAAFTALDALDHITLLALTGHIAVDDLAEQDGTTECHDARCQHPTCDGIVAICHMRITLIFRYGPREKRP